MCKMFNIVLIPVLLWFSTCIQLSLSQDPTWDIATSSPVFGGQIELRCNVTGHACCTDLTRIWSKVVLGITTQIMSNGATSLPSKYSETVDSDNDRFSLFISNLEESDVDIQYICRYGNTDQHMLTMDDSYIYKPTESCPMKVDGGQIKGTLNVTKAAPLPSLNASYGGSDWSSYLTVTGPTAITGNVKFYTISASLDIECTCGIDKKLTLSVLTGTVTTNVCDQLDLCDCGNCAGGCYGYSLVGLVVALFILIVPVIMKCVLKDFQCKNILIVVGITAVAVFIISLGAVVFGLTECACRCKNGDIKPWFIILGLVPTWIIAPILIIKLKQKGTSQDSGGSSCWPPCKVDQEPENPRPRKKPSEEKPSEKPVAVIRSQPKQPKAKHIKTESNEMEKPSYENKGFTEKIEKRRPLPPLTTIEGSSPRPLPTPQLPNQVMAKQLPPLDTQKKKKKKKKRVQSEDSEGNE